MIILSSSISVWCNSVEKQRVLFVYCIRIINESLFRTYQPWPPFLACLTHFSSLSHSAFLLSLHLFAVTLSGVNGPWRQTTISLSVYLFKINASGVEQNYFSALLLGTERIFRHFGGKLIKSGILNENICVCVALWLPAERNVINFYINAFPVV